MLVFGMFSQVCGLAVSRKYVSTSRHHLRAPQAVFAALFSRVHGGISVLDERLGVDAVGWREHVADRHTDMASVKAERVGLRNRCEQLATQLLCLSVVLQSAGQHHKLITAKPRNTVTGAHRCLKAAGNNFQQFVTGIVTKLVVYELESIEVKQVDGKNLFRRTIV